MIKTYLIDVDRTLTRGVSWTPEDCLDAKPNIKIIDRVNEIGAMSGNNIVIYTARRDVLMSATFEWLKKHLTCPFSVSNYKIAGDLYVDTDSVRPDEL